ncbi:MAG TPA: hypothetical protein VHX15_08940 [Frankiaceae bacterium]|jgi:hypothetical protein|nr:hypothetical protein [Frankiaceae bacterium]
MSCRHVLGVTAGVALVGACASPSPKEHLAVLEVSEVPGQVLHVTALPVGLIAQTPRPSSASSGTVGLPYSSGVLRVHTGQQLRIAMGSGSFAAWSAGSTPPSSVPPSFICTVTLDGKSVAVNRAKRCAVTWTVK